MCILIMFNQQFTPEVLHIDLERCDWRYPILQYLMNPNQTTNNALKPNARKYVLLGEQAELFKRGANGLLLKCIGVGKAKHVIFEEHEGICGVH